MSGELEALMENKNTPEDRRKLQVRNFFLFFLNIFKFWMPIFWCPSSSSYQ
jgi:hypothetical protein